VRCGAGRVRGHNGIEGGAATFYLELVSKSPCAAFVAQGSRYESFQRICSELDRGRTERSSISLWVFGWQERVPILDPTTYHVLPQ
jgi:hypothetical protein